MSAPNETAGVGTTTPGLVQAVASCICGLLGFVVPFVGIILAIVGVVLGRKAYKIGKANGNDVVHIVGMIGGLVSLAAVIVAAIALIMALFWGAGLAVIGSGSLL